MLLGEIAGAKIGRVADDGISLGPGGEEGVGAEDILVEVIERQIAFEFEGMGVLAGEFVGVVFPEFLGLAVG